MSKVPIILIGGVPGVGKTSISGYIAREMRINLVFSGDYIRESLRSVVEPGNILNTSVYDSWKFFGDNTEANVIKGFISQGEIVNRATNKIVKRAILNGEPMIIETLYFIPEQLNEILSEITPIYIYIDDEDLHVNRLNEREKYTHFGSPGIRLSSNIKNYRIIMRKSLEEATKFGINTFDNRMYEETRDKILRLCIDS